ncbi:helicase associated domain-containing protein [Streptomyces sp. G5(2025)]|uniref:helicase associated domain-containing protein n=1 Tax=Streptomyces sp. G5(2025) TaxID=3406628 RepID=UPI003C1649FD
MRNRQPGVWQGLMDGQRERLDQLGITPLTPPAGPEGPARPSKTPVGAFEKGVAALAQYKARTGSVKVPRAHTERLGDGTEVRLGVWIMNQKTRRAKLTTDRLAALANLGIDWV